MLSLLLSVRTDESWHWAFFYMSDSPLVQIVKMWSDCMYVWQILSSLVGLTVCCTVLFDSTSCQCFLSLKCMRRLKAMYGCARSLVFFHHILYDEMDTPVSGPVWAFRSFDLVTVKFLWKLSYCESSFICAVAFLSFLITILWGFFFLFSLFLPLQNCVSQLV